MWPTGIQYLIEMKTWKLNEKSHSNSADPVVDDRIESQLVEIEEIKLMISEKR